MTRSWTSFCSPDERQGSRLMRIPSQEEKVQAILDARAPVAEYLASIGKVDAFESFTRDEICGLIRVAQEGAQASRRRRVGDAVAEQSPYEGGRECWSLTPKASSASASLR